MKLEDYLEVPLSRMETLHKQGHVSDEIMDKYLYLWRNTVSRFSSLYIGYEMYFEDVGNAGLRWLYRGKKYKTMICGKGIIDLEGGPSGLPKMLDEEFRVHGENKIADRRDVCMAMFDLVGVGV